MYWETSNNIFVLDVDAVPSTFVKGKFSYTESYVRSGGEPYCAIVTAEKGVHG